MATVTPGKVFTSNEIVTPANLNLLGTPAVALADNEVTAAKIATDAVTTAKIADANVTTPKLAAIIQQALVPAGAILPFAMNSAPSGWLAADGTAVSRTTYSALFAAIGTTYGIGNGSTTFNLPDLRGYFVRGAGTNTDGTASGAFGQKQADAVGPHTHAITDPGHNHTWNAINGPGGQNYGTNYVAGITSIVGLTGYSVGNNTTGISINNNTGTETRPDNIALLYCIKV